MSCPSPPTTSGVTLTAYNDGIASSSFQLYASSTQQIAMSIDTWPDASTDAFATYINGAPRSTYIKLLPLSGDSSLSINTCCSGAVTSSTFAAPTYGTSLSVDTDDAVPRIAKMPVHSRSMSTKSASQPTAQDRHSPTTTTVLSPPRS